MAHAETHEHLSPEEMKFREYFQRGDDFRKIELYRYSKYWFEQAQTFNINKSVVDEKLALVNELIRKETRSIIAVLIAAAVIIGASILIF